MRRSRSAHPGRSVCIAALIAATGIEGHAAQANEIISYSYDALGRLTNRTSSGTANNGLSVTTAFDAAGNRTSYSVIAAGPPAFSIANAATVTEGGPLSFVVTKLGSTTGSYSVNYATANGSAAAGSDYTAASGTLTFAASDATKTITVGTIDDAAVESAETVLVNLTSPSGGATFNRAQATGTINDNDVQPVSFTISGATVTEGGTLAFTVTKNGSSAGTFSVNYASANGSAVAGSDYNGVSGSLTFGPSDTSKVIAVGTIDDTTPELAETMVVNLSSASSGASISTSQATGTINDNDSGPVSFSIGNAASVNEGGTLVYTVTKTGSTAATYSVNYSTANGSAASGSDFNASSGTLSFAPGETSKTISVSTIDDDLYENDESVLVNLSSPSGGATIASSQGSGVIVGNDLHPPVAVNDTRTVGRCSLTTIDLTANDLSPDGFLPLRLVSLSANAAGRATIVSDSSIQLDAQIAANQFVITYTVQDSRGAIAQSTGTLTVNLTGSNICN